VTAPTTSALPGQDAGFRPVPWRNLAGVAWRQHRLALAGVAALLGSLALYLLIMGLLIRHAYAGVTDCHPAGSPACQIVGRLFNSDYYGTAQTTSGVLQVIPVLAGVFVGAPLLARELETGTFRFAWTQGSGRLRWIIAKLVLLAVALTGAAAAFSVLFSWYYHPFFAEGLDGVLAPQLFDLRGVDFAAWTLAAFAVAAFAGMLIRRTVPAMAASIAAWAGLDLATVLFLRKHYQAPVTARSFGPDPGLSWVVRQWWQGPGGRPADESAIRALVQQAGPAAKTPQGLQQLLTGHGYWEWSSYQPASRFWSFQFIEGGWLLALSLLLLVATVWLVRHRAA
jgi:hypothetical protein